MATTNYDWLGLNNNNTLSPFMIQSGYKMVNGQRVFDPYNKINISETEDQTDRTYEKFLMKNQLEAFNLQKADYERDISKENKAQANLDNASFNILGRG